ncbi:uncharacterized protein LOC114156864 isoform X27 [Xiphophorus couchianus]|uniref:uncharacterized protein LOC114156864 isoform X27 n=1 Tax=Xiphophorus couchianus TaxID=32473 RepID=UPI0010166F13|nr:uncharacterized protein LOC114156864 isoform X27 [Xiphophorus couchianus]
MTVVGSSGTELDEDVSEDVVKDPSAGVLTIKYETDFVSMVELPEESQPSSSDSQETLVLSESPSAERQRLDTEAKQTGTNIQEHLDAITTSTQPYLLAVGRRKKVAHQFFIILDKNAIASRSTSSLGAFDKLFKAHYVFATTYNPMLCNMFTFIQTTVYNIDVGKVKESPCVAEIRARLLQ